MDDVRNTTEDRTFAVEEEGVRKSEKERERKGGRVGGSKKVIEKGRKREREGEIGGSMWELKKYDTI